MPSLQGVCKLNRPGNGYCSFEECLGELSLGHLRTSAGSGGDYMPYTFRQAKLGKLVGKKT